MTAPFLGEIRMFGCNFAPRGWASCSGQVMSIQQNTALFSLLGTYYGGNGQTNFALPDLQGRAPMAFGNGPGLTGRSLGESGGSERVTLSANEMPSHSHTVTAQTSRADRANATGAALASGTEPLYVAGLLDTGMHPQAVGPAGNSFAHNNLQPYLAVNFCIALQGIYPARQ
jgi:microcystin-dependent protein